MNETLTLLGLHTQTARAQPFLLSHWAPHRQMDAGLYKHHQTKLRRRGQDPTCQFMVSPNDEMHSLQKDKATAYHNSYIYRAETTTKHNSISFNMDLVGACACCPLCLFMQGELTAQGNYENEVQDTSNLYSTHPSLCPLPTQGTSQGDQREKSFLGIAWD